MDSPPVIPSNTREFVLLASLLFQEKKNVFLSGVGGTGKSYLLRQLFREAEREGIATELTATTGIAAYNIGGMTIHRWSGVRLGQDPYETLLENIYKYKVADDWRSVQLLIIDEISMLGQSLFEKLHLIAQEIRKSDDPFGGIQLLVSGDFLQLPPINDTYVFESSIWNDLDFTTVELTQPYRYPDVEYFNLLKRVRRGVPTQQDLSRLSSRVQHTETLEDLIPPPTYLFSRRNLVDSFNLKKLQELDEEIVEYKALDSFISRRKTFRRPQAPVNYNMYFQDIIPSVVQLKKGASVMLIRNLEVGKGLVNGARGIVKECREKGVLVTFPTSNASQSTEDVLIERFPFEVKDRNIIVTRNQIPLLLAYAITVHKIQGLTLDSCVVDLGASIFSPNMAYVALSRCKRLEGLYLSRFQTKSIYADPTALAFENSYEE